MALLIADSRRRETGLRKERCKRRTRDRFPVDVSYEHGATAAFIDARCERSRDRASDHASRWLVFGQERDDLFLSTPDVRGERAIHEDDTGADAAGEIAV